MELVLITIEIFLTSRIKIFFRQTACLDGVVDNVQIRQLRIARLRLRLDKVFDEVLCFGGGSKRKYVSSSHPRRCRGHLLGRVDIPSGRNEQTPNRPIITLL